MLIFNFFNINSFSSIEGPWREESKSNWGKEFWEVSYAKCPKENHNFGGVCKGTTIWLSSSVNLISDSPFSLVCILDHPNTDVCTWHISKFFDISILWFSFLSRMVAQRYSHGASVF